VHLRLLSYRTSYAPSLYVLSRRCSILTITPPYYTHSFLHFRRIHAHSRLLSYRTSYAPSLYVLSRRCSILTITPPYYTHILSPLFNYSSPFIFLLFSFLFSFYLLISPLTHYSHIYGSSW